MSLTRTAVLATVSALVAVPTALGVPAGAGAAPASPDATKFQTCGLHEYKPQITDVTGSVAPVVYQLETKSYPVKTTITKGEVITTKNLKVLHAKVTASAGIGDGASATLEKVVSLFVKVHASIDLQGSISSTSGEAKRVMSQSKEVIPGNTTIAWYKGRKTVSGTFRYSQCEAIAGDDTDGGRVYWHQARWSSYSISDSGGVRCDRAPQTSVARVAQRLGCA